MGARGMSTAGTAAGADEPAALLLARLQDWLDAEVADDIAGAVAKHWEGE